MSRVQLALDVDDLDTAITFYSKLVGLGVEVAASEVVHAEIARLTRQGMFTEEEIGTTCCFATQDQVWVTGPGGRRWEVYTVLSDSDTFGPGPEQPVAGDAGCCGRSVATGPDTDPTAPACCG